MYLDLPIDFSPLIHNFMDYHVMHGFEIKIKTKTQDVQSKLIFTDLF